MKKKFTNRKAYFKRQLNGIFPRFEVLQLFWEERLKDIKLVMWSKGNNIRIYYVDIHNSCIVGMSLFFPFHWTSKYGEKSVSVSMVTFAPSCCEFAD